MLTLDRGDQEVRLSKINWSTSDFSFSACDISSVYVWCFVFISLQQFGDNSKELCITKTTERTLCENRRNRLEEWPGRHLDKHLGKRCFSRIRKSTLWLVALGCYCYKALPKRGTVFPSCVWSYQIHMTHNTSVGTQTECSYHNKEPQGAPRWEREKEKRSGAFVNHTASGHVL